MHASKTTVVLSVLAVTLIVSETQGQDSAVGLYFPDFRALRALVNPKGKLNLPAGFGQTEVDKAWQTLSTDGRDLLLQERDLALLVVDSNGSWLYRTSGVHKLKSLHGGNRARQKKEDFTNLTRILSNLWFRQLRDFYDEMLFARDSSPQRLGTILASVDNFNQAGKNQKDWFRSIVGTEISQMDNAARKGLLVDETYGAAFANAVAIAKAQRGNQLDMIAKYLKQGSKENVDIGKIGFYSGEGEGKYVNIVSVGDKKLWEFNSHTGVVYVRAADDDKTPPVWFDQNSLQQHLKKGHYEAYFAPAGTQKVYGIYATE